MISNPKNPSAEDHLNDVQTAARAVGQQTRVFRASSENEIDAAFAGLVGRGDGALLVADDPFFSVRRSQIVALAARHAVPTIYYARDFTAAGGLMGYGSGAGDNNRRAGRCAWRILMSA